MARCSWQNRRRHVSRKCSHSQPGRLRIYLQRFGLESLDLQAFDEAMRKRITGFGQGKNTVTLDVCGRASDQLEPASPVEVQAYLTQLADIMRRSISKVLTKKK